MADLLTLHLTKRPTVDGKVLGIYINGAAIYLTVASDHTIAEELFVIQFQIVFARCDKRVQLMESAGVQKKVDSFAGCQFAFGMLFFNPLFAAAKAGLLAFFTQFQNSGIFGHTHSFFDRKMNMWIETK